MWERYNKDDPRIGTYRIVETIHTIDFSRRMCYWGQRFDRTFWFWMRWIGVTMANTNLQITEEEIDLDKTSRLPPKIIPYNEAFSKRR